MIAFPDQLRRYRERADLSCNELARAVGVDPSYVSRLERGERDLPRRRVVEGIAAALQLDPVDTDRLLVSAGYAPVALAAMGTWDPALEAVAERLADPGLSSSEIATFRQTVTDLATHWGGKRA